MDTIFTKYFKGLIRYEGIQRIDEYPMPREVLREAVLNAVVHRDYSTGNPTHIKIYKDKLIIYNDCQFPLGLQPESLLKGSGSKPHNPLIANAFFRSGQIEAWGRGIEKMKKGCATDSLPEPKFEFAPTTFSVHFQIRNNNAEARKDIYSVSQGGINDGINDGINSGITEARQKAIDLMRADPRINTQQIADALGIGLRAAESHVRALKGAGLVQREGAKKNGRWIVKLP
jgi:ATP-dependent DNA helicase RecG